MFVAAHVFAFDSMRTCVSSTYSQTQSLLYLSEQANHHQLLSCVAMGARGGFGLALRWSGLSSLSSCILVYTVCGVAPRSRDSRSVLRVDGCRRDTSTWRFTAAESLQRTNRTGIYHGFVNPLFKGFCNNTKVETGIT